MFFNYVTSHQATASLILRQFGGKKIICCIFKIGHRGKHGRISIYASYLLLIRKFKVLFLETAVGRMEKIENKINILPKKASR